MINTIEQFDMRGRAAIVTGSQVAINGGTTLGNFH